MPFSSKERQKRYRKRVNEDPKKREEVRRKDRERKRRKKNAGQNQEMERPEHYEEHAEHLGQDAGQMQTDDGIAFQTRSTHRKSKKRARSLAAEKQRRYRGRINEDPKKREEVRRKDRERKRRKKNGQNQETEHPELYEEHPEHLGQDVGMTEDSIAFQTRSAHRKTKKSTRYLAADQNHSPSSAGGSTALQKETQKKLEDALANAKKTVEDLEQLLAENEVPAHLEPSDQMECDAQTKAEKIAQDFKADFLLDRAKLAFYCPGCKQEATPLLEEFCALKPDNIYAKVLLAECYLESETHKAEELIDAAEQKLMSSGLDFKYFKERADEYFKEADEYFKEEADEYFNSNLDPDFICHDHPFRIRVTLLLLQIASYSLLRCTTVAEDLVGGQNQGPSSGTGSSALQQERRKKLEDTLANATKTVEDLEQLIGQKQSAGSSASQQERQKKLENAFGNARKVVEDLEQILAENQDPTHLEQHSDQMKYDAQTKAEKIAQDFKADVILDKATLLMKKFEYDKAIPLLEDFCSLKPNNIFAKVLLAECWKDKGEPDKAKVLIDTAKQDLASSTLNFEYFIKSEDFNPFSTCATLFLQIAIDLLLHQTASPDKQVEVIYECMKIISNECNYEDDASENEVKWMKAVYNQLKSVENADPCTKALAESLSCFIIGKMPASILEEGERMEYLEIGVKTMEHQLGTNASKYKQYAYMLWCLGDACMTSNKHSEAESYYVKAIKAFQEATDFDSDSERESAMEEAESLLRVIRLRRCISTERGTWNFGLSIDNRLQHASEMSS